LTPLDLFEAYRDKAEKMASSLCWHYQVSGALAFQEEAKSEALMALWKECQKFDPQKQGFQRKQYSVQVFWNVLLGDQSFPLTSAKNPYANFWIYCVQKVRGRVIDFFRAQRLITKQQPNAAGIRPKKTLLYRDRFISTSTQVSELRSGDNPSFSTLLELLPSLDRADGQDEHLDRRKRIRNIMTFAHLSDLETKVVAIYYSDSGISKKEIAQELGISQPRFTVALNSALEKMRGTVWRAT
jgi:DNA-directed RNA polymerase specialized sigma24 family protein